jgi:hypothetical protein
MEILNMKLQQVIDVILYMNGEKKLSNKEFYNYDIDKDGKIEKEDLISMFESYAKNVSEIKSYSNGYSFRQTIKKLFKSDKLSSVEKDYIKNNIASIATQYIVEIESTNKMYSTKKGAKMVAKKANIKDSSSSISKTN